MKSFFRAWGVPLAILATAIAAAVLPLAQHATAADISGPAVFTPTKTSDGYTFVTERALSAVEATGYSVDQRVSAAGDGYRLHAFQVKCTTGTCTGAIRLACTGSTGAWACAGAAVAYYSVATGDKDVAPYTFRAGGVDVSTGFGVDVVTGTGDFVFLKNTEN